MPISTSDLSGLPDVPTLEKVTQSLAMLDAILCEEWENRYFSFNARWHTPLAERMASMRNGSGDEYFVLFTADGAIMKGFGHESLMSPWANKARTVWPGVLDHVPAEFTPFLSEPAFSLADTTFCIWRRFADMGWKCGTINFPSGKDPDGSASLLWAFDGDPTTYCDYARDYFEIELDRAAVDEIYKHVPLSPELVRRLNPEREWPALIGDASEIAYPYFLTVPDDRAAG